MLVLIYETRVLYNPRGMEGHQDSLSALQRLLETWAAHARDAEIRRMIETLANELRGRGYDLRFEMTRQGGAR